MPGIGVVFNPKSRQNLRDPGGALRLARRLGSYGAVREARSMEDLAEIAEDFRRENIDVLAISGGDGTNTVTLSGFASAYAAAPLPRVALLRGGTMNTVANSIGVRRASPELLLGHLVDTYARDGADALPIKRRYTMRVSSSGALPTHVQVGFLFGTGVVHGFLAEYYATGAPSPAAAAKLLVRGSASAFVGGSTIRRIAAPFRGTVTLENGAQWIERDYLAVAAGTIAHIGLGFRPFYRFTERGDAGGGFQVLGIHATAAGFVAELGRVYRGQPMRPGVAYDAVTSHMVVHGVAGPIGYMIDGDLHASAGPVEVRTGPRVRLVVTP
ncbi:MAG: diacylglycerol kinase family protein [Polyangiaceae bacterium]|jgi:diacylglycerol kinase family enzyme